MTSDARLERYRAKRDLSASGEPTSDTNGEYARFVIQRHDASSLHFDFRLEAAGVLKSWAVPKGPSTDPQEKRLARRTEDHPVDYAGFEGRIPSGEYGAGTVIVWDTGAYANLTNNDGDPVPVEQAVDDGHVTVRLDGRKLSGGYSLTRIRSRGEDEDWLLVKTNDEGADRRHNPVSTQPESVLSGQTNANLTDDQSSADPEGR